MFRYLSWRSRRWKSVIFSYLNVRCERSKSAEIAADWQTHSDHSRLCTERQRRRRRCLARGEAMAGVLSGLLLLINACAASNRSTFGRVTHLEVSRGQIVGLRHAPTGHAADHVGGAEVQVELLSSEEVQSTAEMMRKGTDRVHIRNRMYIRDRLPLVHPQRSGLACGASDQGHFLLSGNPACVLIAVRRDQTCGSCSTR